MIVQVSGTQAPGHGSGAEESGSRSGDGRPEAAAGGLNGRPDRLAAGERGERGESEMRDEQVGVAEDA